MKKTIAILSIVAVLFSSCGSDKKETVKEEKNKTSKLLMVEKYLNDIFDFRYNKVANEVKSGSIIIENANWGLGHYDLLRKIDLLEPIEIDDIHIFVKK